MGFPSLLSSKAPERIIKCGHPSDWDTCSAASRCLDRLQRSFTAAHTHPCIARLILGLTGNVGASFTAVNDNRPLDVTLPSEGGCACVRVLRGLPAAMTLEHKDACGCVVDRSLFEFPEWAAAWRWAVAHYRGRRCLPRLRFRSWSEQPSFFVFCHHP